MEGRDDPDSAPASAWRRLRALAGHPVAHLLAAFLVLALVQGFLVKLYAVPSASMEQTLLTGDRLLTDRTAYWFGEPQGGDVVVFVASDSWEAESPITIDSPIEYLVRATGEVFGIGPGLSHTLVKRVVAVPGEVVECCSADGRLLVDGVPVDEPYASNDLPFVPGVRDCTSDPVAARCFGAFLVPEGEFVVLGDNRGNSADSVAACRGRVAGAPASDAGSDAASDAEQCVRTVRRDDIIGRVFAVVFPSPRLLPDAGR